MNWFIKIVRRFHPTFKFPQKGDLVKFETSAGTRGIARYYAPAGGLYKGWHRCNLLNSLGGEICVPRIFPMK